MLKPASDRPRLVLASASARRLQLLTQVGIEPDKLLPAEIDEAKQPRNGGTIRQADCDVTETKVRA